MISHIARLSLLTTLTLGSLIAIAPAPASAQSTVMAGTLTCMGDRNIGLIIGSRQRLTCRFVPAGGAPAQRYSAVISRFGLDIGVQSSTLLVWTVLGASARMPRGALAGRFVGASANAAFTVGVGANALVGGSRNSIVLQPLSVQAQTGVNIAAGVTGMRLTYGKR